jgi:hypothetical protein
MASLLNGIAPDAADNQPYRLPLMSAGQSPVAATPPDPNSSGMNRIDPGPRANHMAEADAVMALTPQEKFLYNTHLQNLNGTGKIVHSDGSISSLLQMSFEGDDGKIYNIPTVVGGKQLPPNEAIKSAIQIGLDKFPSYASEEEAESRYNALHEFLGRDTGDFIEGAKNSGKAK